MDCYYYRARSSRSYWSGPTEVIEVKFEVMWVSIEDLWDCKLVKQDYTSGLQAKKREIEVTIVEWRENIWVMLVKRQGWRDCI